MGREESFITMKLIWHSYLVFSVGNYDHETPTETGLRMRLRLFLQSEMQGG